MTVRNFSISGLIAPALLGLTGATLLVSPALADVKTGVIAWQNGEYDKAVAEWRPLAVQGDADAQFNLGQAYKLGRGVPMDLNQAAQWFKKAADQGHLQAADNYGLILFQNNRREEAMPWIRQSAARGEPRAQYVLGTAHFNGDLAEKDWVRAYALMTRASAKGLPQASKSLSSMDRYIPLEDRQKAMALAAQLEQQSAAELNRQSALAANRQTATTDNPVSDQPAAIAAAAPPPPAPAPAAAPPPVRTASADTGVRTVDIPASSNPAPAQAAPAPAAAASPPIRMASSAPTATRPPASYAPPVQSQAPAPAPVARPAQARPAPVAPAPSADGPWRVQLGAFSNQGSANNYWDYLSRKYSALNDYQPYLVDSGRIVQVQIGGFSSHSEAAAACSRLKSRGVACFPTRKK